MIKKSFSLNPGFYLPEMNLALFVITVFKSTPIPVISGAIIQVDYGLLDTDKILIEQSHAGYDFTPRESQQKLKSL